MSGKTHSITAREQMSISRLGKPQNLSESERQRRSDHAIDLHRRGVFSSINTYSRARRGVRQDIGPQFFRSRWEANYARYLNFLLKHGTITAWDYEPETFWFESIRRGVRSYLPDFRITDREGHAYYIEIKGWMDPKSKTKLKRMAKYYPTIDLRVICQSEYRQIQKDVAPFIEYWEYK